MKAFLHQRIPAIKHAARDRFAFNIEGYLIEIETDPDAVSSRDEDGHPIPCAGVTFQGISAHGPATAAEDTDEVVTAWRSFEASELRTLSAMFLEAARALERIEKRNRRRGRDTAP